MTKKKRNISEEQLITAIKICKKEGLALDDVSTVYTIYKAMSAAIGRVNHKPSYRDRGILFTIGDSPKSAAVNVIRSHHFKTVKRLNQDFRESGFNENLRIELDRIDNNGHYSLDNINFTTKEEHARKSKEEKCIPVQLLAFANNGGLRLGGFESKSDARKQLGIADGTLTKMIDGDFDYTNKQNENMTFLQLIPVDEPIPKFKVNDEDFLKSLEEYVQSLINFQKFDYCEKRAKAIDDLSKRLDYYTQREKQS